MSTKKRMIIRVASAHMEKQALFGLFDKMFKDSPDSSKHHKTSYNSYTLMMFGSPQRGVQAEWLKNSLGFERGQDSITLSLKGKEILVTVGTKVLQKNRDYRDNITDLFTTITASGVDSNISDRELESFLRDLLRKERVPKAYIKTQDEVVRQLDISTTSVYR
jgi:hypothetical protein